MMKKKITLLQTDHIKQKMKVQKILQRFLIAPVLSLPADLAQALDIKSQGSPQKEERRRKMVERKTKGAAAGVVHGGGHHTESPVVGMRKGIVMRDLGVVHTVEDIMMSTVVKDVTRVSRLTIDEADDTVAPGLQYTPGVRSPVTEVATDALPTKVVFIFIHYPYLRF